MAFTMQLVSVKLGVPYLVAKLICSAVVFLAWTYPHSAAWCFASQGASS